MLPIKRAAMQMHHSFDVKRIGTHAVNDGVRKTVKVELAIVALDSAPMYWIGDDAVQGTLKFIQKDIAQTRLLPLIPQCRSLQFFVGLRVTDDAHGAFAGY